MFNSKNLLTFTAIVFASLGIGYIVAPEALYNLFGITPTAELNYMARRYAAYMIGMLVIVWMARGTPNTAARRAVMMGTFVLVSLTAAASLYGALTGVVGPIGWGTMASEVLVALWFVYLLFIKPEPKVD